MAKKEKKRGVLLAIWLAIMLVANFSIALIYMLSNKAIAAVYPNVASWIFYIYGLLALANLVFVIFLFMWKKWAFFAFCGSAIIAFIMNLSIGVGIVAALFGLTGPIILYLLMRPKWARFE